MFRFRHVQRCLGFVTQQTSRATSSGSLRAPSIARPQHRSCSSTIDHRQLAASQNLLTHSIYTPGSPMFLPAGAEMMNKLMACLRSHYPQFGFREVITPTLYKTDLWKISGHWENYKDDMFLIKGSSGLRSDANGEEDVDYGMKPMNCPGHCLLFADTKWSYRDMPVRYADFSALHRNEISGALTGLTRVRRFHQDDGHIFCRPSQIKTEIQKTMDFIRLFYWEIFGLNDYRLVLSTRPDDHFIGEVSDWQKAEEQLKAALNGTGQPWTIGEGDGAFYGPKIDIILKDANGNEHQTATIQLDFQLPRRFKLAYPVPSEAEPSQMVEETPVLIHRAVAGSLERFLALLIEHYNGSYPFWFSPAPVTILSVSQSPEELAHVDFLAAQIRGSPTFASEKPIRVPIGQSPVTVETDTAARSLGKKIALAKKRGFNFYVVVGPKDVAQETCSLTFGNQRNPNLAMKELANILDTDAEALKEKKSITVDGPTLKKFFKRLHDEYL